MYVILFICTGNTCRSPMAQYLMEKLIVQAGLEGEISVRSAGLSALEGDAMSQGAQTALLRRGAPLIDAHAAQRVTNEHVNTADLVLTMTQSHKRALLDVFPTHKEKIWTLLEYADMRRSLDIEDPYGQEDDVYERTAQQIEEACAIILQKVRSHIS